MMTEQTMLEQATSIQERMVGWRRDFHMHPELSYHEIRTAAVIADELDRLGYRVRKVVDGAGVIADLGTGRPAIALRADIDALPISEKNSVPYASQNPGVMHACGHDAHAAILLGVATLLARRETPGAFRLLFQPAEEIRNASGEGGATRMVQDGALDGIDAALALHVDSTSPVGKVKVAVGPLSAGTDTFRATIRGIGGHGAYPHQAIDPIYIAAHVVLAIDSIVARCVAAEDRAVVNVCAIHAGGLPAVIPGSVEIAGSIRYKEPAVRETLHSQVKAAVEVARAFGGEGDLQIQPGILPIINDERMASIVRGAADDLMGAGCFAKPDWGMAGDDFSVYAAKVPSLMLALGGALDGSLRPHHNPHFDIDERCLPIGAAILAESALRFVHGSP
jgi:amidohydrolase